MSAFAPLVGANSLADSGRDGVVSDTLVDEILLRDGQLAVVIATVIAALDRYATQPGISRAQLVGAPRHLARARWRSHLARNGLPRADCRVGLQHHRGRIETSSARHAVQRGGVTARV